MAEARRRLARRVDGHRHREAGQRGVLDVAAAAAAAAVVLLPPPPLLL
eukprot:SAG11_NODE_959_length_6385_cov_30.010181_1_plen_47_part_10